MISKRQQQLCEHSQSVARKIPKLFHETISAEGNDPVTRLIKALSTVGLGILLLIQPVWVAAGASNRVPWAIATSGRLESARPTLQLLGVHPDVPVITRDQVAHAKPDPDLFLTAAARLGVEISDSIVVGDSVWDLLAARRARALGVGLLSGGYGKDELEQAGAYRVYQDPADLLKHLDEVGVRTTE
jgi:phosphoglycolate phosphatase-like HAD superfamily hydrolase